MVDHLDRRDVSARSAATRETEVPVTGDPACQEIALLLRRLNVELDAVGQRFAERYGLNRTDVRALVAIMDAARRGEALTAGRLGEAVDLRSASVTALVDRPERVGHVRRGRGPPGRPPGRGGDWGVAGGGGGGGRRRPRFNPGHPTTP